MATTTVGIAFEVYNRGARELAGIERSVTTVGRSLRSLVATTAGLAGVGSISYGLVKTAEGIDRIAKASDQLGITTEQLTGLEHAATLSGLSVEDFGKSVEGMTRRMAEAANGTGTAGLALRTLGLDARQLTSRGPAAALYEIADAMTKVPSQADRMRLAGDIFGDQQVRMVNFLQQGSAAIRHQEEETAKLGLTFSRLDAANVEAATVALKNVREVFVGVARFAVIELSPYVEALANTFTEAATAGEGFGSTATAAFETSAMAAARLLDQLNKIEAVTTGPSYAVSPTSRIGRRFGFFSGGNPGLRGREGRWRAPNPL
jgi:hypothetical protein